MNPLSTTSELGPFAADCRRLLDYIEFLIADQEYEESGGRVLYAVDCSELYAQIYPSANLGRIRVFYDDDDDVSAATQFYVLDKLLYGLENRPLLLAPYAIELRSIGDRIRDLALRELRVNAELALVELRKILDSDIGRRLVGLGGQFSSTEDDFGGSDYDADVIHFFTSESNRLIRLLNWAEPAPSQALRELLEAERFDILTNYVNVDFDVDMAAALDEKLSALRVSRPRASSALDAIAIASVVSANRELEPQGIRVRLVTASPTMHRLLDGDLPARYSPLRGSDVLRHPGVFIALHAIEGMSREAGISHLRRMRASLALFLANYEQHTLGTPTPPAEAKATYGGEIGPLVRGIKLDWRISSGLMASLSARRKGLSGESGATEAMQKSVADLMRLAYDPRGFRQLIVRELLALADGLGTGYQQLAVFLQTSDATRAASMSRNLGIKVATAKERHILRARSKLVPYAVEFQSAAIYEWYSEVNWNSALTYDEVILAYRGDKGKLLSYELLLFLGFISAAWDKWDVAELYVELALLSRDEGDPVAHEAWFFRAVCIRMRVERSASDFRKAVQFVNTARELKRTTTVDRREDPRYLVELGILIFEWDDASQARGSGFGIGDAPPSVSVAFDVFNQALNSDESDEELKAKIYNNLAYYYLSQAYGRYGERLRKQGMDDLVENAIDYAKKLIECLGTVWHDEDDWPAACVDTVVWSRFLLGKRVGWDGSNVDLVRALEKALVEREVSPAVRRDLIHHMGMIRRSLFV